MKKIIFVLVIVLFTAGFVSAATTADVIVVVDESGSMGGEHAWIGPMIQTLDQALIDAGVTNNQYGLVGFGGGTGHLAGHAHDGWMTDDQFAAQTSTLVLNGGTEDGYSGIQYALNNYTFRGDAAVNLILITDEDRDILSGSTYTYANTLSALTANNALLNVCVDATFEDGSATSALGINDPNAFIADGSGGYTETPGGVAISGFGTTIADYVDMALATGAAAWDLNKLRLGGNDATSFTAAFVDLKVGEIQQQQPTVPAPGAILLAGLGTGLVSWLRRRRMV